MHLKPLSVRRVGYDVKFIYNLLNCRHIDAPDILSQLHLSVPSFNSRFPLFFKNEFHATNYYGYATPLDRTCRTVNNTKNIHTFFDLFSSIVHTL